MHPISRSQSIHSASPRTPAALPPALRGRGPAARTGRTLIAASLSAAAGFVWLHTAHAAGADTPTRAIGSAMNVDAEPPEPYEPMKRLQQIIRFLYELFGGDPANLGDGSSPEIEMMTLVNYYAANGVPADLTAEERAQGRLWVEEAYDLAIVVAPQVDPGVLGEFMAALESMYADLGGAPNDLGRVAPAHR